MRQATVSSALNIADLRELAYKRAHRMVFDYIDGGADDEKTLSNNNAAFDRYTLMHKVLTGTDAVDTSTRFLGEPLSYPFFPSPTAGNRLFHCDGERAVARAAERFGCPYSLSTLSTVSIEEIATHHSGRKWFQLYVWKDRGLVKEMLDRAREAGYESLILTVDFAIAGNRERDPRNGFTIPPKVSLKQAYHALNRPAWSWDFVRTKSIRYANLSETTPATSLADFVNQQLHAGFNWHDAEWLLGEWQGSSIIKGVVRADDAKRAVSTGFDAISVSNHGGRQLDTDIAPIDALANIVEAVGSTTEIVVDGGIRRGTDILKALAMGATAVSFGRPYLFGLAAGGEAGAFRSLQILAEELRRGMSLLGVRNLRELDSSFVRVIDTELHHHSTRCNTT